MAYEKQNFTPGQTLTAAQLNHIEAGVSALDPLIGETATVKPTQVREAVMGGRDVILGHTEAAFGTIGLTGFILAEDLGMVISSVVFIFEHVPMVGELVGTLANDAWYFEAHTLAKSADLPATLPSPHALSFTGAVTGSYDGSSDVTINIPASAGGGSVTAQSVKDALGYTPANVTDVFANALQPAFTNVFDTVDIIYGKELSVTEGLEVDSAAPLAVTGFIPVSAGDIIRVNEDFRLYCVSGKTTPKVVTYDSTFTKLQHVNNTSMVEGGYYIELLEKDADGHIISFRVNKPSNVAYMRICNNTEVIGKNPVLTINEEIRYEMGYGTKLNPDVRLEYGQLDGAPLKNGWSILPNEHLSICYSGINRKPINTVEHFTDAAENFGYNALKCDVRPTSDGELICCHDAGFTFDGSGYITAYDSGNQTLIHDVMAATCLGYSFKTGEHPCLVGDYLDVCRKYGKVAFVTIRDEYMDVVIPKLLEELRVHNMLHSTIINSMTYESLVQWRQQDQMVMLNYTLNYGVEVDQEKIDRAVSLGYCSLSGFSLSGSAAAPSASCDFEYARANGIRLLEAIAYHADSPETCYEMGYDGCTIGFPWGEPARGMSRADVQAMIDAAVGAG